MARRRPLGVGVIGAGGANIATSCHLPAIQHTAGLELKALQDVNREGVRPYAEEYGVDWYTDLAAMLARDDVDVVQVCSPDPYHAEQTIAALEAGKHVMCQKPMALSVEDAQEMAATAARVGRRLTVCHNMRWLPRNRKLRELIEAGEIGAPVYVRCLSKGRHYPYPPDSFYRKRESLGQFVHNGPHYVDLVSWLMGSLPAKVFARSTRHYPTEDKLDTDNYVAAMLEFENGTLGSVELNLMVLDPPGFRPEESLFVVGTKGTLKASSVDAPLEVFGARGTELREAAAPGAVVQSFVAMMEDFVLAIREDRPAAVTPEHAVRVMATCLVAATRANEEEAVRLVGA